MAQDKSVYLVYSVDDGVEWSNYLVSHLSQAGLDVRCVELDSSGSLPASLSKLRRSRVIVLLASPGFGKSLMKSDSLDTIVNRQPSGDCDNPVILFLCGMEMTDFEGKDDHGRRLSERFPGLNSWKTIEHKEFTSNQQLLSRAVSELAKHTEVKKPPKTRPRMKFRLVPDEVRCEVCDIVYAFERTRTPALTLAVHTRSDNQLVVDMTVLWHSWYSSTRPTTSRTLTGHISDISLYPQWKFQH